MTNIATKKQQFIDAIKNSYTFNLPVTRTGETKALIDAFLEKIYLSPDEIPDEDAKEAIKAIDFQLETFEEEKKIVAEVKIEAKEEYERLCQILADKIRKKLESLSSPEDKKAYIEKVKKRLEIVNWRAEDVGL